MKPYVVGMTGASGAVYGIRLAKSLLEMGRDVVLIFSDPARLVLREETGVSLHENEDRAKGQLFSDKIKDRVRILGAHDFLAPVASGSYPVAGMVIIPCSMASLGAVASGAGQNLIHRAADCSIKEGRRLVLVPRETPLSAIHLENMLKLARLGVRIVPAMPAFYSGIETVDALIDFVVGKVLDQLDVPHCLYPRWTGSFSKEI